MAKNVSVSGPSSRDPPAAEKCLHFGCAYVNRPGWKVQSWLEKQDATPYRTSVARSARRPGLSPLFPVELILAEGGGRQMESCAVQ